MVTFIHDVKIHWKYPLTVKYEDPPSPCYFKKTSESPSRCLRFFQTTYTYTHMRCDVRAHLTNILYILSENALKSWFYGKQVVNVNPCSRCTNFTSIFLVPNYSLHQLCWEMTHWEIISVDTVMNSYSVHNFWFQRHQFIVDYFLEYLYILGDNSNQSI